MFTEYLVWLAMAGVFLFVYVGTYSFPTDAVLPHIRVFTILIFSTLLIKLILMSIYGGEGFSKLVSSTIFTITFLLFVIYYALVLIGLEYWNRVISLELILPYIRQLPQFLGVLGVSPFIALVFSVCVIVGVFFGSYVYMSRFNSAYLMSGRISNAMRASVILLGAAIVAITFTQVRDGTWAYEYEPISLTINPTQWKFQNNYADRVYAAHLDRIQEEVRRAYVADSDADLKNIILIVVDALRPENMGLYGYERNTTPYLSRLAEQGKIRRADIAHAVCAESSCGLLAIAASNYVHEFSRNPITLQEVLRKHGYEVHMLLSGDHTSFYGLKGMYGPVDSYFDATSATEYYGNDDRMVLSRLEQLSPWDGTPTMLQLHLMSAHTLGMRFLEPSFLPEVNFSLPRSPFRDGKLGRVAEAVNFYDNGVIQTDLVIEKVFRSLEEKGYLEDALILITADHGEALGEHNMYLHAHGVYEPILRIPLIMIEMEGSGDASDKEATFPSQVDFAPSILYELGMPIPETWSGKPMQDGASRTFTFFQQGREVGLVDHRRTPELWKYWIDEWGGEEYVFEIVNDPGEKNNRVYEVPAGIMEEWRSEILSIVDPVRN